ncbi:putative urate catabolism protein [Raoultella ornithinolytica]|nr:putative urate catabolism protein [Raoultella ornithinolytica]
MTATTMAMIYLSGTEVPCGDGSRKPHLIVPYTLDANDMRFATAQGFNTG